MRAKQPFLVNEISLLVAIQIGRSKADGTGHSLLEEARGPRVGPSGPQPLPVQNAEAS